MPLVLVFQSESVVSPAIETDIHSGFNTGRMHSDMDKLASGCTSAESANLQ